MQPQSDYESTDRAIIRKTYRTLSKSLKRTRIELEIQMLFELCYKIVKLNELLCVWQPASVIR